jgi:hypothetical protein
MSGQPSASSPVAKTVTDRRQRRKALHGSLLAWVKRFQDYLLGDLVWRYGSSVARPVLTFGVVALLASTLTYLAPLTGGPTGLYPKQSLIAYSYQGWRTESAVAYLNVLYFFLTAPAGGSQDQLTGWVKTIFVLYLLIALWLIALTFEASTKRLGSNA